jgi:hypothetical protein
LDGVASVTAKVAPSGCQMGAMVTVSPAVTSMTSRFNVTGTSVCAMMVAVDEVNAGVFSTSFHRFFLLLTKGTLLTS